MKKPTINLLLTLLFFVGILGCGGGQSKIDEIKAKTQKAPSDPMAEWQSNKGIGPVKSLILPSEMDPELIASGRQIFESMCSACHKIDKKFIGPSPKDILTRRTPEWTMNMILNPSEMVQKDPIAKQLLIEANGSPMANQNLSEEDARAVLEYFRSL
ncbi:cytochrome c [Roseivirga sp. E12]|uniref:c-type cytochrome n=1 Tax=Roseivirga sp. E12 TaxID=2819237 RepID=UPI001ABC49F8|nr:cytochrome c [Roseivirga sp. E12]MBO3699560.1 cytochrome c [Roseivirga sp. E12]